MPGQYAKLEIPLGLGIKTDVDDKLLPVGKVVDLQNGIWDRTGEIIKRPGTTAMGTQYSANTPGTMPKPWQLATHKGAAVTVSVAGPRPVGVYSPGVTKWVTPAGTSALDNINGVSSKLRGQILPSRTNIYRANSAGEGARAEVAPDFAVGGAYAAVAWLENNASTATIRAQFIEIATGKKLFDYSQAATFGSTMPRIVHVNSQFQLVYVNGATVGLRVWTDANVAAGNSGWQAGGETVLASDAASIRIDAIAKGTDLFVIYNSATNPRIIKRDSGGTITVNTLTDSGAGALNAGTVAWMRDRSSSGKLAAIVGSTAQGVRVQWDITGGLPVSSYTIDGAAGQPTMLTGATITSGATGEFVVIWEVSPGPNLRWGRRTVAAGITTATWILSAGLASTIWLHNAAFYMLTRYDSATQGTLFVSRVPTNITDATDNTRTPSARFCTGQSVTLSSNSTSPPDVTLISADVFMTALNVKTRLVASPVGNQFDTGIDTATLTYNPTTVNSPREFADNLYVCGGVLGAFDGITFAEEGFHLSPETPTVTQQAAGSLTDKGNYQWQAVYRYTDNYGRIRRSAPSEPTDLTAMTGSNHGALVTVKTLKLHGRPCRVNDGGRPGSVVIELYRTSNNEDDDFGLVAVVDNDESVDTITITDTAGDASIGDALYTNGGVLESQPPPPALALIPYKDRLAVISAEDPTLVWVSLPLSPVEGPRFHEVSTFRIDDTRGNLTALGVSDDRMIQFKRDAVYTVTGDGPDELGNGTFGLAQLIGTGIGCVEPRSIVEVPDGVIFRSTGTRSGIHLVNRGLAVEYIGGDVQAAFQEPAAVVADAIFIPALQRTEIFLSTSGIAYVYDHTLKLWSTFVNAFTCAAATVYNNHHIFQSQLAPTMAILEENSPSTTLFSDDGAQVIETIETPWISLAQLKGFQRFKRIQGVGETRVIGGAGDPGYTITATLMRDFDEANVIVTETRAMAVTDDFNAWELRYSAKVSALKIRIAISQKAGDTTNYAGPKISGLVLVYQVKEGLRKIVSSNRLA